MTSISDRDDLERRLTAMLSERAAAIEVQSDPNGILVHPGTAGERHPGRGWAAVAAATIAVLALGLLALARSQEPDSVRIAAVPPTPPPSTEPATTSAIVPADAPPATPPADTTAPDLTSAPVTNGWVAFDADLPTGGGIYLVRPGEDARRVEVAGSDSADEACPAWSPDGTRLLYGRVTGSAGTSVDDAELVIVPVGMDGAIGDPTVIALDGFDVPDGFEVHPCGIWAPDGRWVALAAADEVWVVDTQTGAIRREPAARPIDLEWRPGTDQLVIAGDMTNRAAWVSSPVLIYSVSTGELRQLGSVEATHVTWSPDGSTLAYTDTDVDPGELWLVDADGANERLLVADIGRAIHGIGPVWSPTGERIAYQRLVCDFAGSCGERHEVVLVSVADGTETVIAPPQTGDQNLSVSWYPLIVTWSPDGTTLLYTAWNQTTDALPEGVIAVPADTPSDATVLDDSTHPKVNYLVPNYKDRQWVWSQMWGRQPT